MISDSKRHLKIPKQINNNAINIAQVARRKAKKEKAISSMALVFRAHFSTWKAADEALGLSPGLLYQIAQGKVKDSPSFRKALGLIPDIDKRHGYYRPRYSPARMRAVLASADAQRELLDELLAEFERRLQP